MGSGAPGEGMEGLRAFPTSCPMPLFHLAVPEFYPFIRNQ